MDIQGQTIVLRHSIREAISDAKDSYHQKLTPEGVELAEQLGQSFARYADHFILFHSPIPRCEQTALVLKQTIEINAKQVLAVSALELLGGFFYRDFEYCAKLMDEKTFTRQWFENSIPAECIMPIRDSGTTDA